MRFVLNLILGIVVFADSYLGWNQFVPGSCDSVYNVNDDNTYEMYWNGNDYFFGCRVSFHGFDSDRPQDHYKVCINATIWDVTDSNVKLQYYSGTGEFSTSLSKEYTRFSGDPTIRWCSFTDDYVDIKLTTSQSTQNQGKITLSVTGENPAAHNKETLNTYNNDDPTGAIVGGTVGGLIFMIVIIISITIAIRRRFLDQRLTTTHITAIITNSGPQQMQEGIANPGYTTEPEAPPPYHPTDNQYSNYPGQPPQHPVTEGP